ncbi:hypothetical protein MRX96_003473 [Rhipicephalus microplus]
MSEAAGDLPESWLPPPTNGEPLRLPPVSTLMQQAKEPCWVAAPAQPHELLLLSSEESSSSAARPFQCTVCGKQLASRNVHQLHMRSHSGEKPFGCALCGHRFSQKTSLTRHMRSHTGERPFPCEGFANRGNLNAHAKTHHQS